MNMDDVKKIIEEENLKLYNMDENQPLGEEEVVLRYKDGEWSVSVASERAAIVTGSEFKCRTESEALEDFIIRLRIANELLEYRLKKRQIWKESRMKDFGMK